MELKFSTSGKGAKNIILLHGWSGSAASLSGLERELAKRDFKVYNIDLPGFGGTEPPPRPYYLRDYAQAIAEFISEKKIERPYLAGHSFGGKLSLYLAAKTDVPLSGVVVMGASGIRPRNSLKKKVLGTLARAGNSLARVPLLGIFAEPARKLFYKLIVREQDYYRSGELRQTFVNIVNEHLDKDIPNIKLPLLAIWGESDRVTPIWMGQRITELVDGAELKSVALGRHDLPKAQPEIVAEMIYNKFK